MPQELFQSKFFNNLFKRMLEAEQSPLEAEMMASGGQMGPVGATQAQQILGAGGRAAYNAVGNLAKRNIEGASEYAAGGEPPVGPAMQAALMQAAGIFSKQLGAGAADTGVTAASVGTGAKEAIDTGDMTKVAPALGMAAGPIAAKALRYGIETAPKLTAGALGLGGAMATGEARASVDPAVQGKPETFDSLWQNRVPELPPNIDLQDLLREINPPERNPPERYNYGQPVRLAGAVPTPEWAKPVEPEKDPEVDVSSFQGEAFVPPPPPQHGAASQIQPWPGYQTDATGKKTGLGPTEWSKRESVRVEKQAIADKKKYDEEFAQWQKDVNKLREEHEERQKKAKEEYKEQKVKLAKQERSEKAAGEKREKEKGARERAPLLTSALTFGGETLMGGLKYGERIRRLAAQNKTVRDWLKRLETLEKEAPKIKAELDKSGAAKGAAETEKLLSRKTPIDPSGKTPLPGAGELAASGLATGTMGIAPELWDMVYLPKEAEARKDLKPSELATRMGLGAASGISGTALGSKIPLVWPYRVPPKERTEGLMAQFKKMGKTPRAKKEEYKRPKLRAVPE